MSLDGCPKMANWNAAHVLILISVFNYRASGCAVVFVCFQEIAKDVKTISPASQCV